MARRAVQSTDAVARRPYHEVFCFAFSSAGDKPAAKVQRIIPFLFLLFLPLAALADGMVIPTVAYPAKVTIPDQRALICYTNGTERLVIETRFTGSGTNFAWVVPLPNQPVIEEATTGLFPTLQYLFRPEIIREVPQYYGLFLELIWVVYVLQWVRPTGRVKLLDFLVCLSIGAAIAILGSTEEASWGGSAFLSLIVFADLFLIMCVIRLWNHLPRSLGVAMLGTFLILQSAPFLISGSLEPLEDTPKFWAFLWGFDLILIASLIFWYKAPRIIGTAILLCLMTPQLLLVVATGSAGTRSAGIHGAATLGASNTSADSTADLTVSILDRKIVGIFETTTITSKNAKALQAWLSENGYVIPANSEPVIADYVKDGWVFVATKVRRDNAGVETSTPHPLSFTFRTGKAVYPMRLTGLGGKPLDVELYVFGQALAQANHFKVERCTKPEYPTPPPNDRWSWDWQSPSPVTLAIVHPLLRNWAIGFPVATKLVGKLSPADMRKDFWLDWRPFTEQKNRLFSRKAALTAALNWSTGILGVSLLVVFILAFNDRKRSPIFSKLAGIMTIFSLSLGVAIWLALPKTEVRLVQIHHGDIEEAFYSMSQEMSDSVTNHAPAAVARAYASNWARQHSETLQNHYLGGPVREEDSPGNYVIREVGGKLQFVCYDAEGAEYVQNIP